MNEIDPYKHRLIAMIQDLEQKYPGERGREAISALKQRLVNKRNLKGSEYETTNLKPLQR